MENLLPTSTINEALRESATQEVVNEQSIRKRKLTPVEFIQEVGRRFIEKQIDAFPTLCEITRMQNKIKQAELRETGKRGKYTESYGWSEKGEFFFEYEIPSELHLFMTNLVYRDFWSNENKHIWRRFMSRILKGEDAMEILMWAKSIYGSNQQKEMVV